MADAGCSLLFPLTTLAVMGIWNVLLNVRHFFRLLRQANDYFSNHQVDLVVLIDYPGFNWCIARRAKRHGIPVVYYGVPQMWAWAPWRVRKLRRLVDHVLCKLPFEEPWFRERGVAATCVGHPYFDEVARYRMDQQFLTDYDDSRNRLLVLLPGSRTQEVTRNIGTLLESARQITVRHSDVTVAVACFSESHANLVRERCRKQKLPCDVMVGKTPELIRLAEACIACSGSVSLELLYHRTPSVIVYRVSPIVRLLSRFLLRARYITLVNLLASDSITRRGNTGYDPDRRAGNPVPMPEYLCTGDCSRGMARWINDWLAGPRRLSQRVQMLDELADRFAIPGASARAATYILEHFGGQGETPNNPGPKIAGSVSNRHHTVSDTRQKAA